MHKEGCRGTAVSVQYGWFVTCSTKATGPPISKLRYSPGRIRTYINYLRPYSCSAIFLDLGSALGPPPLDFY